MNVKWYEFDELSTPAGELDLALQHDDVTVSIGHLGGDRHRSAFADIFARVLRANDGVLAALTITTVRAKRAVALEGVLDFPATVATLQRRAREVAERLYDSHNESVDLALLGASGERSRLRVHFDEPSFSLVDEQ
jgi:hypothetical protein